MEYSDRFRDALLLGITTILSIAFFMTSEIYCHIFLLRLPTMYCSRLGNLIEAAQDPLSASDLGGRWSAFSSALVKRWKLMNVLCGLLLTTTVALLQISGISGDPLTNALGIISMICALNGLLLGIIYLAHWHLSALKDVKNAVVWLLDTSQLASSRWRNAPAVLAAPAVWLAWAMISFLTLILAYTWRAARTSPFIGSANAMVPAPSFAVPMCITGVLFLALAHFVLVVHAFTRFGTGTVMFITGGEPGSGEHIELEQEHPSEGIRVRE
ncbi:hypothetical protein A0H81_10307 [Grifola frondosa]|uniref:Uncharacterized protein n=1 Tax=Grifola frondosa TaxID=5627 RepID=A0A1C7LY01_GRIFR|nr:hypothetical protein A0H81_10307 [Grifola frondosa]